MDDALTVAKYEDYIKRRTAESWTEEQENILQMWAEKASGWAWLHDKSARYYNNSGNKIMYPNIIIGTLSGGLGLVATNLTSPKISNYINVFVACTNILCASLTSLNKYLRSNEKAEIHLHMNKLFSSFARRIVLELTLNPENRRDSIEFCKSCRDEYDKLVNDSIIIPSEVVQMYKDKYNNVKHKPEVCNGLIHFTNYSSSFDKNRRIPFMNDTEKTSKRLNIPIVSEETTPKEKSTETTRNSLDIVPMRRLSNIV